LAALHATTGRTGEPLLLLLLLLLLHWSSSSRDAPAPIPAAGYKPQLASFDRSSFLHRLLDHLLWFKYLLLIAITPPTASCSTSFDWGSSQQA
jgi:hypothetical protein